MKSADNLVQAIGLIQEFLIDRIAPLPDDVQIKLREIVLEQAPGPDNCRTAMELIYARRDELPVELLQIGVQITTLMTSYQQLGYQNGRGNGIAKTLIAMPGVLQSHIGKVEPPKPDQQFVKVKEEAPVPVLAPVTAPTPVT